MFGLLFVIFLMILLFGGTGALFRTAGGILGGILSVFGWVLLAILAVTLFGAALFVLPIILIVGVVSLICGAIF